MAKFSLFLCAALLAAAAAAARSTTTEAPKRGSPPPDDEKDGEGFPSGEKDVMTERMNLDFDDEWPQVAEGNRTEEEDGADRIIGGFVVASDSWYPFSASVHAQFVQNGEYFPTCSATVITPYWTLTAAHCVVNKDFPFNQSPTPIRVAVRAGTRNLYSGGQFHSARWWIYHQNFIGFLNAAGNFGYGGFDIAVIKLWSPFQTSATLRPAILEAPNRFYGPNTGPFLSTGWGRPDTVENGPMSPVLKAFQPYTTQCDGFPLNRPSANSILCGVGRDNIPSRPCRGDSGGFLGWYSSSAGNYVVTGAVSSAADTNASPAVDPCENPKWSSVSFFNGWILAQINAY